MEVAVTPLRFPGEMLVSSLLKTKNGNLIEIFTSFLEKIKLSQSGLIYNTAKLLKSSSLPCAVTDSQKVSSLGSSSFPGKCQFFLTHPWLLVLSVTSVKMMNVSITPKIYTLLFSVQSKVAQSNVIFVLTNKFKQLATVCHNFHLDPQNPAFFFVKDSFTFINRCMSVI